MSMNLFSDVVTVAGVSAGILLFLALAVAPWLTELPAPRRRALPTDATGSLPRSESPAVEVAVPTQGAARGSVAVREAQLVLPVQRTTVAITVPGQRAATHLS
jgi:hypothetical protein